MIILLVVLYTIVGALLACRLASVAAWRMVETQRSNYPSLYSGKARPDGDQWFGGALLGLLAGSVWPVSLIAFLGRGRLFAPPKHIRDAQREEYIADLEARLELEPSQNYRSY